MKTKFDYDDDLINGLIFEIEKLIFDYDEAAHSRGIRLTDSNIKSALSKVKKFLKGDLPQFPESNEREKMISFMGKAITKMIRENMDEAAPSRFEWNRAVAQIEDSIKLRQVPGGRDYLDFLAEFIPEVIKKAETEIKQAKLEDLNSKEPRCGLCGATKNLTKTECCGNWICDDEDEYVMFSFERNSCHRNHRMRSLCAYHYSEKHPGDWKSCSKCKDDFKDEPEQYVVLATNEGNFECLEDLPSFEKKRCSVCSIAVDLDKGGYSIASGRVYTCHYCNDFELPDFTEETT